MLYIYPVSVSGQLEFCCLIKGPGSLYGIYWLLLVVGVVRKYVWIYDINGLPILYNQA